MAHHYSGRNVELNLTEQKQVDGADRGLYAKRDILARERIISIQRPLIISLDTPRLKDTCYCCLGYTETGPEYDPHHWKADNRLQICTGCHVVRYCSKVRTRISNYGHQSLVAVKGRIRSL